ncbi:phospholipid phosphatase homolog 1.2 homolog isoform X2 [Atheta coriaria]|uniref:phospholipid phosphatase homolog 1.2 homolog isoform X2 n=1 Tax=Dalotia coriaria TaxID=877792 RepID=UPI0031F35840
MSYNYYYFEDKDKNATSTSQEESTITNEIKLNTTKADPMGNAHAKRTQVAALQLNDSSASERINGGMDHKDIQRNSGSRLFRLKYVINLVLGLLVTAIISGVEFGFLPHTKQSYICKDPKLSYKYNGDTIRPSVLGVVCVLLPLVTFFCVEVLRNGREWKKVIPLMWRWTRFLFIGNIVINLFITEVLKSVFGEPRPHFFDTCAPDATACTAGDIVESYRCTNSIYSFMVIRDSSRSFPSGHASLSVFTSVYCAAYIYYRFKSPSIDFGSLCKPFTMALVMLWGPACGLSRITDHRHHWWDVLSGSILGVITAVFTIYALANRFRAGEKHRASLSSTKLCDENKDELV